MMNGKMMAFQGLSQYHQSRQNNEKKEIGEELCRLAEALRLCQQSQSYFTTAGTPNAFKAEMAIIQKAYDLAKKDNDFIVSASFSVFKIYLITSSVSVSRTHSRSAHAAGSRSGRFGEDAARLNSNGTTIQRFV